MIWHYILDESGNPVPEPDPIKWGTWMAAMGEQQMGDDAIGRHVAVSRRGKPGNEVRISTIFLGTDHASPGCIPQLFETMVFGQSENEYCERYATRAEAVAGHALAVALVEALIAANA